MVYLLRGADAGWRDLARRFARSYAAHPAGIEHKAYVIYKDFADAADLTEARRALRPVPHAELHPVGTRMDIDSYLAVTPRVSEQIVCFLNSHSEILGDRWLLKLWANLCLPGVGMVGATGSFEGPREANDAFPVFPNVHLRTTGFMIRRDDFATMLAGVTIADKQDTYRLESGIGGLTNRVLHAGLEIAVVGRDGRGYGPRWWPVSDTFRQATQRNLLIGDNHTRHYEAAPYQEKITLAHLAWGDYLTDEVLRWPPRAKRRR
jgi:hypothetical protein